LAKIKLGNLPRERKDCLKISAYTVVYKDGKIYGKPKDRAQAIEYLNELNGDKHLVYSGVAIYFNGKVYSFYDRSAVLFKRLSEKEIADYVDGGSPMDKAGAYGIQDDEVVAGYRGSYTNIVGLPMEKLKEKLDVILKNATERI
ncbi:MAG: Maf family protein, partial [Clostridia bacterium]|nr:Maf family protein [Clostridia bacterium]